ncbi:transcriptional regulator NrdR [Candidatus Roizmanbacteria bacterium CG10_big_fil_rev_8_21_14_0_10_45_7]|uniref:Transcriptional repressor NrdR n=1 Tax=Candidatus Roizmanbacteria bacterium CG10_big_fil_rev_8_21_14_0_10_45_7 TaxID=1974854 RepID=A0A2M8KVJ5_9BACT|nr:MAG: transcriptional regulator NrdR [Candidatus Roizmanbacteria bacterium CG10_big_fil_rev_8_21_14_0_10_45_7]
MKCPFCGFKESDVVETRISEDGAALRRRRVCGSCAKRYTTYERVDRIPIVVIKRDGRRDMYDRSKLLSGIIKAFEKTKVTGAQIELLTDEIEEQLRRQDNTEIQSSFIGNLVAQKLKKIDKVAYIRFASVFKRFVEVEEFERELKKLL